jgi:hypothetical protein
MNMLARFGSDAGNAAPAYFDCINGQGGIHRRGISRDGRFLR